MLRIRLQRFGTKNEPSFRMVVAESTTRRDGRFVELLGHCLQLADLEPDVPRLEDGLPLSCPQ